MSQETDKAGAEQSGTQETKPEDTEALRKALQQEREARKAAEKRASDAEGRVADFERESLVSSVVTSKGIPEEALELLTGTTKEELEASADKILALVKPRSTGGRPKEDLIGGASNEEDNPMEDAKKIADRIVG